MPSPFSAMATSTVSILHVTFGEAATYSNGGAPLPCSVILSYHDEVAPLAGFDSEVRAPGWEAQLKQAEVPTRPPRGETITLTETGQVFTIRDVQADIERAAWVCDVI